MIPKSGHVDVLGTPPERVEITVERLALPWSQASQRSGSITTATRPSNQSSSSSSGPRASAGR